MKETIEFQTKCACVWCNNEQTERKRDCDFLDAIRWSFDDESCDFYINEIPQYSPTSSTKPEYKKSVTLKDIKKESIKFKDLQIELLKEELVKSQEATLAWKELVYEQLKENDSLRETLEQIQALIKQTE